MYDTKHLYSGMLEKEVLEKICRNSIGLINIPAVPKSLEECVLMIKVENETKNHATDGVRIGMVIKTPLLPKRGELSQYCM